MKQVQLLMLLIVVTALLAGCGGGAPEPAVEAATNTPAPPADTPAPPADTPAPPADTPAPPTDTPAPPTDTPAPPTDTPAPPADTPEPTAEAAAPKKPLNRATIPAPALADNLLGEPAEREIVVVVPPSYNDSDRRYPVIYFLAGYDEGLDSSYILSAAMQEMVEAGTIKEMIAVVVSGQNSLGGSFYVNSPVLGNWEDFVVNDVVGYVDQNYRTIGQAGARGISGFSMGGFGALNLAMLHPELFGAVYALSPGLFAADGLAQSQMFANESEIEGFLEFQHELAALSPEEAAAEFLNRANQGSNLRFTAAYGAAFAPNPQKNAPYVDYPYAEAGGERDETAWQRWDSGYGGLPEKVETYRDNLLSLKGIVIDYGTRDQYRWIPEGVEYFSDLLEAAEIPHRVETFEGGHGNLQGRAKEVMLPFFSETLAGE